MHQVCVNWHNEIWFDVKDIELKYFKGKLNLKRFDATCYLCGETNEGKGSCIDCDYKTCKN